MTSPNSDRRVLRLRGAERFKFLQGLVTNDVRRLQSTPEKALYTALLTPQGKLIVDFFLVSAGEEILIDVDASQAEMLLKRLSMYKLRSDVELEMTDIAVARGVTPPTAGAYLDPRAADMGWRAYDGRPSETVDWPARRVAQTVPTFGAELGPDSFILEMGFERLNGVDFKKGCYVGQEVTARMKHKTALRKGLVQVDITGDAPVGCALLTEDGKEAGTLYTQAGGKALAYLRFDRADGPLKTESGALVTYLSK